MITRLLNEIEIEIVHISTFCALHSVGMLVTSRVVFRLIS
jgi:hypothetical protein